MLLHTSTMEENPAPLRGLWATWPEAILMHSYLALRVENKRWTAKIRGQQTQLSGRDQQTCSIMNTAAHAGWLFCTILYPFPQLFPSSLCPPTIIPICALFLSPISSPFCLFRVQGLTSRLQVIQPTSTAKRKFAIFGMFSWLQHSFPISGFYQIRVSWKTVNGLCLYHYP